MTHREFFEIACNRNILDLRAEMGFAKFAKNMGFYKSSVYGSSYQMEVFKMAILAGKVPGLGKKSVEKVNNYLKLYDDIFYPED